MQPNVTAYCSSSWRFMSAACYTEIRANFEGFISAHSYHSLPKQNKAKKNINLSAVGLQEKTFKRDHPYLNFRCSLNLVKEFVCWIKN